VSDKNLQRLSGVARLYGDEAFDVFQGSHVAIVGIGGVGSWIAEALARSGIGQFTLIDLDEICVTNVNRQIHALTETVGQSKTEVMKTRILSINPNCVVNEICDFVGYANLEDCMSCDYDFVVDAIDLAAIKAAIVNWCKRNKVPVICIGGAGGKINPAEIKMGDINKTKNDPLLATVRSQLRAYHGYSRNPKRHYSIECVYSTEQVRYPDGQGGTTFQKPGESMNMDCNSGFGSATHITGSFAFFAAGRILEKLIKNAAKESSN
jgi:tRNA A37 threonylcarbamoyladenosine dehydratase